MSRLFQDQKVKTIMLKSQADFSEFLRLARQDTDALAQRLAPRLDAVADQFKEVSLDTQQALSDCRLLVPVIGAYSSGKSSFLNGFLATDLLPVGISPETALACELCYDTSERIAAVPEDSSEEILPISHFQVAQGRSANFEYLRVFLDNPALKMIEPLILVDMPGFDSPLDAHNKAILRYIDRGAHYIVLFSVEEGGLNARAIRQLTEILDNGRTFTLVLSKADLRTPEEVTAVASHTRDQLSTWFGPGHDLFVVKRDQGQETFAGLIETIDPDRVVRNQFLPLMKDLFFQLDSGLSAVVSALDHDEAGIQRSLREIEASQGTLEAERDRQLEALRNRNLVSQTEAVLRHLEEALGRETAVFINAATLGPEVIARQANEVVRESLVQALRRAEAEISDRTVRQFARAMEGRMRADLSLSPDRLVDLMDRIKSPLLASFLESVGQSKKGKTGNTAEIATLSMLAMSAASKLSPLLTVALSILPAVVDWLFESYKGKRERDRIEQALRGQVYPDLLRQLRPEIEGFLGELQGGLIAAVEQQYSQHLAQQRAVLGDAQRDYAGQLIEIADQFQQLKGLQESLRQRAETLLFNH
jgi:hypothetical protein